MIQEQAAAAVIIALLSENTRQEIRVEKFKKWS